MRYTKTILLVTLMLLGFSCNNWLDVKPIDRVSEEQLYSTEPGFMQALNGIYVELNNSSLYGGELLYKTLEILAQRYQFSSATVNKGPYNLAQFDYTTDYAKDIASGIWKKAYNLIANANKLLLNAETHKDVFSDEHYNWITGETYALRAFLHFDLLRLFGPVYATHKNDQAICYNTKFALSASDMLTAAQVIDLVLADLKEAEKRLVNDPIIEEGPLMTDAGNDAENYWRYRSMRLNYYAVKALQARVYLYAGMKTEACEAARVVTGIQEKWFPFIKYTDIVGNTKNPDRIFSTELLFSLQNPQRNDIFDQNFSPELIETQMLMTPKIYLENIFGTLAAKDWRYEPIWLNPTNHDYRCFHKYEKTENTNLFNEQIPLIRVSEMYYILAEASNDKTEALNSMNLILENRGLNKLETIGGIEETLKNEYQKEFWGEGQLFFYYKRMNAASIPTAMSPTTDMTMDDIKYKMPLPEIETDFR